MSKQQQRGTKSWPAVVAAGISSAVSSRQQRRQQSRDNRMSYDEERRLANIAANQERETLLYQAALEEEMRQRQRRERVRGGANYAQFASPIPGYINRAPISGEDRPLPPAPRVDL